MKGLSGQNIGRFIKKYAIYFVFVLLIVAGSILAPNFLNIQNLQNLLKKIPTNGMLALGMTVVIISGGIDLSMGAVVCAVAMSLIQLTKVIGVFPAMLCVLVIAALIGAINGYSIYRGMPPFIMTLAMQQIVRGVCLLACDGHSVRGENKFLAELGTGSIAGVPYTGLIYIVFAVLTAIILKKTVFGRATYAIGGNEETARLTGINICWQKIKVYAFSAVMVAVGSILLVARLNSSVEPTIGSDYEMDAITAVIIGGTSMSGGAGSIIGTVVGTLIVAVLSNVLNLMNVSSYIQTVAKGLIIFGAVAADTWTTKKLRH